MSLSNSKNKPKIESDWLERTGVPVLLDTFGGDLERAAKFYSEEVERLVMANFLMNTQLKTSLEEKKELGDRIYELEKTQRMNGEDDKKKRHRRCASEISREFICKAPKCGKSYGSEGSLSQHMKLKHPELAEEYFEKLENEAKNKEEESE